MSSRALEPERGGISSRHPAQLREQNRNKYSNAAVDAVNADMTHLYLRIQNKHGAVLWMSCLLENSLTL